VKIEVSRSELFRIRLRDITRSATVVLGLFACQFLLMAATTGSISGTVKDSSGGVVVGMALTATNSATGILLQTLTDNKGFYSFPSLSVGRYDLKVQAQGFKVQDRRGLTIDADTALQIDLTLAIAQKAEELPYRKVRARCS
jgi:hypothetical protein